MSGGSALPKLLLVAACVKVAVRANDGGAVFIREFTLSRRDHLPEQNPPELGQRPEDPCTVSCGPGLRYRVVLCMDHRGLHAGGCQPSTKPPIKEECLVAVPCYKPADTLPVEAKPAWHKQAIELGGEEQEEQEQEEEEEEEQEEVVVSEEPTFLPGPWRTCSRTCGAGIQQRAVRCRVLLRFSRTVADLPDHECEGVKPAAGRPCYRAPCPHVTDQEGEELHDWEYDGFTECSQSCGGGTQEAVIVCLNKRTGEAADQNLCVSARRPPQLLQACRSQPCPPRWVTGEWTSCSATCGVGLMTRSVECVHQPGRDSNRTGVLRDQDCQNLKPSPVQACNRFDCPPMWDPQDWGQCSSSCGRGVQTRRVRCKQRMADGSNLELPDTFCPSHSPPSQQACSQQECPPTWVAAGWSQCSVTCGSGVQRLRTSCQNQGSEVDPENCFWIPPPPRTRPCSPRPCDHVVKSDRTILAQNKVYVQWRKAKKLHLVVGGHAYLLPWTTLLLRCPTRHFRKGRVRWLKDGKPLAGVPHVSVTALGHLKVQQVRPSDVGVYTCVAGSAHEHFVLQVLGSKRKVAAPEPRPQEAGPDGTFGREFWASLNRYDAFVEQLLELRRSLLEDAAKPGGKNKGNPEDGGSEPPGLFVLIADTYRLDRLLSDGGLGGPRAPQLVAQLFRQLTAAHGDANESTLHPPDGAESSTPAPFLFKPRIKAQTSKSPLIIQRPPKFQPPSADMVVAVGAPVLLQRPFSSLELSCEVLGSPEPSVTWTRNGKKLQQNGRVALMSSGSLKIQSPNKLDEGLYTCTARNRLGSASLSSWLQIIGGRGRHCDPAGPNGTNACSERKNSSHSAAPCSGPRCHHRWQAEPWSPCSASCGGGSQTRSVRCLTGSEGVWSEGGGPACLGAGRKPADARLCNQLPCARWGATHWGPCQGECVGPSLATQQRHLYCQDANGTKVPSRMCGSLPRPGVLKNCSTQACVLEWRVGAWTPCTATCGRHGFQSRPVTCAHVRSGKVAKEHQCAWKPRPPSWQRCNVQSCGRAGECQDSTRYCEKVRQLELCSLWILTGAIVRVPTARRRRPESFRSRNVCVDRPFNSLPSDC
eukprot:XP_011605084.1 PREDICTED: ADAMTS-like protein 1 [Takifugu rubripes]